MNKKESKIALFGDDRVDIIDTDISFTETLEPGFYKIKGISMGPFSVHNIYKDKKINIPVNSLEIAKEYVDISYLEQYFSLESTNIHNKLNIKQKLGILLYGIQGTGKTTACYAIAEHFIKNKNAVVITVEDVDTFNYTLDFLEKVKERIGDFLSIIIFDECENYMKNQENYFKRVLDSTTSLSNHINFFTTNYFNDIPQTITNRPSRIKFSIEIEGVKDEEIIFKIVSAMNEPLDEEIKLDVEEIRLITPNFKGKTLDEIKNNFIDEVFKSNWNKKVITKELIKTEI